MWHYSVEFSKGEITAIIIAHPGGPTIKPTARITGERATWAWEKLGKCRSPWMEADTLRNLWCWGTGFWPWPK